MTVNEALRIARARAPVVTCGPAVWKIGNLKFPRIKSVTHEVGDKGKMSVYISCVDGSATNSLVVVGLDDIELAPDCPEILRKMIYKDKTTVPLDEAEPCTEDKETGKDDKNA